MKNIYQKHHGLPGIPQISGEDGSDGESGRNVYFGYVNDFFDNVEITVDNIVRYAQKSITDPSAYYTGIFSINPSTGEVINDVSNYLAGETVSSDGIITNSSSTNVFFDLYSEKIAPYNSRYAYAYGQDQISKLYAKVDTTTRGWNKQHTSSSWIINTSLNNSDHEGRTYPNFTYDGVSPEYILDLKPMLTGLGGVNGYPLFTTLINNRNFAFFAPTQLLDNLTSGTWQNSPYSYNDRRYTSFTEPLGKSRTIDQIVKTYQSSSQTINGKVDYVKYARKAVDTVPVSDRLNKNIKAGDVIYFYTNKDMFDIDHVVEYMVVITKELERCTLDELIAHASMTNPLSFKYISSNDYDGDSYLETNSNATAVYVTHFDNSSNIDSSFIYNGKNFINAISNSADSILNLGTLDNTDTIETISLRTTDSSLAFGTRFKENDLSISPVNLISTKNPEGNAVLKISNLCVKKYNAGNIETVDCLLDTNLNLSSDGFCYTLEEDDFNPATSTFKIDKEKLFNTDDISSYLTGATLITFDKTAVNINETANPFPLANFYEYSKITQFIDREDIPLAETFGENTAHIILLWVTALDGIKHYSHHTYAEYNTEKSGYDISILEYNGSDFIEPDSIPNDPDTIFICDGISANESSCDFEIYVPETAENVKIFVNTKPVYENVNYSNSWFECMFNGSGTVESGEYQGMQKFSMTVNTKNNIPQLASTDSITSASQLYATPGNSNESYGCDLFNMLLNGQVISTKERSVQVTVKYTNGSKSKTAFYKLTQPGFKDNRKMPTVNLTLNKDLEQLEDSNKIENGVLCNQFQFFVDIDIDDFTSEYWGTFVPEESISLNLDIANIPIDYDFVDKYGIQAAVETCSFTAWPASVYDVSIMDSSNYVSINSYLVNNDISDPYGKSQKELMDNHILATTDTSNNTTNSIKVPVTNASINTEYNTVILNDNLFGNHFTRNRGIQCGQVIKLRNLHFSDVQKGTYRFRVVVELGNPIFSRLFFRYYVANMWVSYKVSENDKRNFYVGTYNLAKLNTIGRYQSFDYMFSTKTLNAFICPMSFTACPYDASVGHIEDRAKLSGSDKQLDLRIDAYTPDVNIVPKDGAQSQNETTRYDAMTESEKIEYVIRNQSIPWFDFSLKKRYMQDSIKNITVQPVHLSSIKDKIGDKILDKFFAMHPDKYTSTSNKDTYLSVVYNANMYNQRKQMRNDLYTFFYNGEELESQKYSQYANSAPIFLKEDASYTIRTNDIINSMYDWNYEYELYGKHTDSVFNGNLSTFGNGYNYVDNDSDTGQYKISLENLKSYNEKKIDFPYDQNISVIAASSAFRPQVGYWFRTLLYQLKWQYPKYYTDEQQKEKVDAFDIVDNGKILKELSRTTQEYIIPYNVTHSIYPRCAYDDEHDTAIVFMLRCPSIVNENKYKLESSDILYNHEENDYNANQLLNNNLNVL